MINFLKYKFVYLAISLIVIATGLFSILNWGYIYSIDFVGGTNLDYQISKGVDENKVKDIFENKKIRVINLEVEENNLTARTNPIDEKQEAQLRNEFKES